MFWRVGRGSARRGAEAGCIDQLNGYRVIRIQKQLYGAHRLAWVLMTGAWAELDIDHINRDRADNRWTNLRLATAIENARNSDVTDDATGFHRTPSGTFRAQLTHSGKRWSKTFRTEDAARAWYRREIDALRTQGWPTLRKRASRRRASIGGAAA